MKFSRPKKKNQKGSLKILSKSQWHVSVVSATHEVEKGGSLKLKCFEVNLRTQQELVPKQKYLGLMRWLSR